MQAGLLPEAVQANEDGLLSVAYGNLVGVIIEAGKELAFLSDAQARTIAKLQARQ